MYSIKKFVDWSKLLAKETGLSYLLIFEPHLQQINDNWNALDYKIADTINSAIVSLLQHNLSSQLIDFTCEIAMREFDEIKINAYNAAFIKLQSEIEK